MARNNTSRAKRATNLTASRGNAGKNKAMSILRELRERANGLPDVMYNYQGKMNARQRREYVQNLIGRKLSGRVRVNFIRNKKLDRTATRNGIRRTLEGYRISYTYS